MTTDFRKFTVNTATTPDHVRDRECDALDRVIQGMMPVEAVLPGVHTPSGNVMQCVWLDPDTGMLCIEAMSKEIIWRD
jgi:hypothetical protein